MVKHCAEINIIPAISLVILLDGVDKADVEQKLRNGAGDMTINEILDIWKATAGDWKDSGFEYDCDGELIPKN